MLPPRQYPRTRPRLMLPRRPRLPLVERQRQLVLRSYRCRQARCSRRRRPVLHDGWHECWHRIGVTPARTPAEQLLRTETMTARHLRDDGALIAAFSGADHLRRRSMPVITSIRRTPAPPRCRHYGQRYGPNDACSWAGITRRLRLTESRASLIEPLAIGVTSATEQSASQIGRLLPAVNGVASGAGKTR
jgi:hypothetical protein